METYRGHVRSPADAIKLFEACRLGILPRVQRRLSEKERQQIQSGSVFVWDEREAGMRRWTDGKSWSASRVSGSFLTYREMEGKRGGGNFVPVQRRQGGKTPDSGRGSEEDADMDGPDGYRYKADGLMKQSFSITTSTGQHLHLISYYARPLSNMPELPQPSTDPALRHIVPAKGMYPESTIHESASPVRSAPMTSAYMPPHMMGHPQQGMARGPYPYPQGYPSWPPSPISTPPYNYPPGMYQSPLPLPGGAHQHSYQNLPPHAGLPPHLQHHMLPQQYDRSPLGHLQTHESMQRYLGQQLPQVSSLGYSGSAQSGSDRYSADAAISRQMASMSQQPVSDSRLPPPIPNQGTQPSMNGHLLQRVPSSHGSEAALLPQPQSQHSPRLNGHNSPTQAAPETKPSQSIPSISNIVHATEPSTTLPPVTAPSPFTPMTARQPSPHLSSQEATQRPPQIASPESVRSESAAQILAEQAQQIAQAADAASITSASAAQSRGSASPATSAAAPKVSTTGSANTPETASVEADDSATPGEAGAPQDIPHAKLSGPTGLNQEDHRAIRVLDRKFCL